MRIDTEIIDNHTGEPVPATLHDEVTIAHFLETQKEWRPVVVGAAKKLHHAGAGQQIPQHWHWDWNRKAPELGLLPIRFLAVECEDRLQGLMKVDLVSHRCRISGQRGQELVYIDYVEVAPWNIKTFTEALGLQPRFSGVGTRLVEAAVRLSQDEGFKGRVGLHSLPASERFYLSGCSMKGVERNLNKQGLLWCEFTPEQAERFLRGEMR